MKIYQVEISNFCNLECAYCPHPVQKRKKGNMSFKVFRQVVQLAHLCGQNLLYLHNFGEPMMNPNIYKFVSYANSENIECSFYTNGILIDNSALTKLYESGLRRLCVSNHIKNMDVNISNMIKDSGFTIEVEEHFDSEEIHDWAGQVKVACNEFVLEDRFNGEPCIFSMENAFVILWDGRISTCCIDYEGLSTKMHIKDLLIKREYYFNSFELCSSCNIMRENDIL